MASVFHEGEKAVQELTGMRERIEQVGRRIVRDFMPDEHRELFEELPFLVIGSLDANGQPWASMVVGHAGFVQSPDPRTLRVSGHVAAGDPLQQNLAIGASIGLLGIQLETRRRNRMNGHIVEHGDRHFEVRVAQSFGNCAQYIQAREPHFVGHPQVVEEAPTPKVENAILSPDAARVVRTADTFFIASASAQHAQTESGAEGVDVSHRGGKPGFVRLTEEDGHTVLTSPDFRGNFLFNTLGNLVTNPRAGLLFVDFSTGTVLSLRGDTEIVWDGPLVNAFKGAERLLRFRATGGLLMPGVLPLRWSNAEFASQLSRTGSWG